MAQKQPEQACTVALDLAWEAKASRQTGPEDLQVAASIIKGHSLSVPLVRSSTFEPPVRTEPHRPAGYYHVFCTHHVPYWRPCSGCKRSKQDAARHTALSGYQIP